MSALALFDFDGTITKKDSMLCFIRYAVGSVRYYLGMLNLLPILILNQIGMVANSHAKQKMIAYFFSGWEESRFNALADEFAEKRIPTILRREALERIAWHKSHNHTIVVVTASVENWVRKWADKVDILLIGTRLEIVNDKLSGRFSTKNCHGEEKVQRIQNHFVLSEYSEVYAYGDSQGDFPMLNLTTLSYYRKFT